jgi:hypothetical protein
MALAIDTSTPAYTSTTTTSVSSLTSVSFTPPLGALLAVSYANGGGATAMNQPSNTGGAVTWDAAVKVSEVANSAAAATWFGTVTTSASMTVTVTTGLTHKDWGFGVVVVTGQAATQNGGTQIATSASGLPSGTIASLVGTNSLIIGSVSNFTNGTGPTIPAGQSDVFNGNTYLMTDGVSGGATWSQFLTGINLSAGSSATINDTAPTIDYALAMVEILAAAGASASIPDLIMAPSHR